MSDFLELQTVLHEAGRKRSEKIAVFAFLALGLIESIAKGVLSIEDAVQVFFNADNSLFVRKNLREKTIDEIMGRGAQLPDLFESLPHQKAQQEFERELTTMRSLCLEILKRRKSVA